ncbi:hypothetical protein H5410_045964 [Solanum commersonii]|uniref:Uncharacterized protein n=1 Tax=Solanum commersonii TaxID=4109 RepID=A0A9J5XCS7_SOLCO|nr:hypothetical protein H5410_045964 [Solanum commersonii]
MLLDPTPSEALTSHPPSTTEASDDERGMEAIDVTTGEKWVSRVGQTSRGDIRPAHERDRRQIQDS